MQDSYSFIYIYDHCFGSEKSPSIAGGVSVSLQLLALKRDGGAYLTQPNVNNEETQVTRKLSCYPA